MYALCFKITEFTKNLFGIKSSKPLFARGKFVYIRLQGVTSLQYHMLKEFPQNILKLYGKQIETDEIAPTRSNMLKSKVNIFLIREQYEKCPHLVRST